MGYGRSLVAPLRQCFHGSGALTHLRGSKLTSRSPALGWRHATSAYQFHIFEGHGDESARATSIGSKEGCCDNRLAERLRIKASHFARWSSAPRLFCPAP